jgi:hypothetical protein
MDMGTEGYDTAASNNELAGSSIVSDNEWFDGLLRILREKSKACEYRTKSRKQKMGVSKPLSCCGQYTKQATS